jgi:hypothetical protein
MAEELPRWTILQKMKMIITSKSNMPSQIVYTMAQQLVRMNILQKMRTIITIQSNMPLSNSIHHGPAEGEDHITEEDDDHHHKRE